MPRAPIFQDTPINYQLSLPQMTMEANARLYNCARPLCHAQAMICQPCDRGHIYCSPSCSQQARHANRKIAQRRYEQSYKGRRTAALRQARFRKNQRLTQLSKLQQASCSAKKSNESWFRRNSSICFTARRPGFPLLVAGIS